VFVCDVTWINVSASKVSNCLRLQDVARPHACHIWPRCCRSSTAFRCLRPDVVTDGEGKDDDPDLSVETRTGNWVRNIAIRTLWRWFTVWSGMGRSCSRNGPAQIGRMNGQRITGRPKTRWTDTFRRVWTRQSAIQSHILSRHKQNYTSVFSDASEIVLQVPSVSATSLKNSSPSDKTRHLFLVLAGGPCPHGINYTSLFIIHISEILLSASVFLDLQSLSCLWKLLPYNMAGIILRENIDLCVCVCVVLWQQNTAVTVCSLLQQALIFP
jgi:hypothetical protein